MKKYSNCIKKFSKKVCNQYHHNKKITFPNTYKKT